MSLFPLFVNIKQKRCIIIGGGKVAQRKIETLIGFDALITVISPHVSEKIRYMSEEGLIKWISKPYSEGDIDGAFMVIAATDDRSVNEKVYNEAVKNNTYVNVADNSHECNFIFPAVVNRDELVIGISTSGSLPALSKRIKEEVENAVPQSIGTLLSLIKEYRKKVINEIHDADIKKLILSRIVDELFFCEDIDVTCFRKRIEEIIKESIDEKDDKSRKS